MDIFARLRTLQQVNPDTALQGRPQPVLTMPFYHRIFGDPLDRAFPGAEVAYFAAGCFWALVLHGSKTASCRRRPVRPWFHPVPPRRVSGRTGNAETRGVRPPIKYTSGCMSAACSGCSSRNHDPTQGNRQGQRHRLAVPLGDLHHL